MTRNERLQAALRSPLVLASASPRRREILEGSKVPFEVRAGGADPPGPPRRIAPVKLAVYLATAKARAVAADCPGRLVVGADTLVTLGQQIMGKPADAPAARAMLQALSGRQHEVHTGLAIALGGEMRSSQRLLKPHW
jgi:septum formation protein